MLTAGYEAGFDPQRMKSWYEKNGSRIAEIVRTASVQGEEHVAQYIQAFQAFEPATAYDDPHTKLIFEPLLNRIKKASDEVGRFPVRPVQLATSTDASPTPNALPTGGNHQLFIGAGTAHFCNYWAKAIAATACNLPRGRNGQRPPRRKDLEAAFKRDPSGLNLATKLLLIYSETGSVIGLGAVAEPERYLGLRLDLLGAMELFIVGHEYGHFIAHEHAPDESQPNSIDEIQRLEFICDQIGVILSRHALHRDSRGWLGYCGAGAMSFFRAIEASERAREWRHPMANPALSGHPVAETRIKLIKEVVRTDTAFDQAKAVIGTMNFYDVLARELGRFAFDILRESRTSAS